MYNKRVSKLRCAPGAYDQRGIAAAETEHTHRCCERNKKKIYIRETTTTIKLACVVFARNIFCKRGNDMRKELIRDIREIERTIAVWSIHLQQWGKG